MLTLLDITTGNCRISQVYVDAQRVEPGDRVTINTSVILFKNNYRIRITVPNLNFTTITPIIPVAFPGVTETVETDFIIPDDTQHDVYNGRSSPYKGQPGCRHPEDCLRRRLIVFNNEK